MEAWREEAVVTSGVLSGGTRGRRREERMRSPGVGAARRREGGYKARTAEVLPDAPWEVGGGRSSDEGAAAKPAGAKGLCLSRASNGGGTA